MAEAQVKGRGLSSEIRPGRTPSVAVLKAPDCDVRRRRMQKLCQTPAGEPAHRHRGIMIAAFFRRGKTLDVPEHMLQDVGRRRADTVKILSGNRHADANRTLGCTNHAGPDRAMIAGGEQDRIKPGRRCGKGIHFPDDLVRSFFCRPQRPHHRIRIAGSGNALPFRECKHPLQKPVVAALPDVAGIGQVHNIVADKSHNNCLPFLPDAQ